MDEKKASLRLQFVEYWVIRVGSGFVHDGIRDSYTSSVGQSPNFSSVLFSFGHEVIYYMGENCDLCYDLDEFLA